MNLWRNYQDDAWPYLLALIQGQPIDFTLDLSDSAAKALQQKHLAGQYAYYCQQAQQPCPASLKAAIAENQRHALSQLACLIELKRLFDNAEIDFLVLKGLPLAEQAFGQIAFRYAGDIDLLIRAEDILVIDKILHEMGFVSYFGVTLTAKNIRFFQHHLKDAPYYHPTKHIKLEMHWRFVLVAEAFALSSNSALKQRQKVNINNHDFYVLNKYHKLAYLCMHATKHAWSNLKWLIDIIQLTKNLTFNWNELLKTAKQLNAEAPVIYGLYYAFSLQGLNLPLEISACIDKKKLKQMNKVMASKYRGFAYKIYQLKQVRNLKAAASWINLQSHGSAIFWCKHKLPSCLYFLAILLEPTAFITRKSIKAFKHLT